MHYIYDTTNIAARPKKTKPKKKYNRIDWTQTIIMYVILTIITAGMVIPFVLLLGGEVVYKD